MINRIFRILPFVALMAFVSCKVEMPKDVIPQGKMEEILYDYHMVQSMSSEYASDSFKEKLFYEYVFAKHNVTKEQFDSSMVWYNRYPKHMLKIYENLEAKLEKEIDAFGDIKGTLDEGVSLNVAYLATDTAELWTSTPSKMLLATPLHSNLTFAFETSDTAFVAGDSLSFSFNASFVPGRSEGIKQEAYAAVIVDYIDGTSENSSVSITNSGAVALSLNRNYQSRLKAMSGFVYYFDNDTTASSRLVLTGISVTRIHPEKKDDLTDGKKGGMTNRNRDK